MMNIKQNIFLLEQKVLSLVTTQQKLANFWHKSWAVYSQSCVSLDKTMDKQYEVFTTKLSTLFIS